MGATTEKVTIIGAFQKGLTKKGNPIYTVNLQDGRQATCFDTELSQKLNTEIDVDVTTSEWDGKPQYTINAVGSGNGQRRGGGFNLEFNQKKTALDAAATSMGIGSNDGSDILRRADKFLEWMQK